MDRARRGRRKRARGPRRPGLLAHGPPPPEPPPRAAPPAAPFVPAPGLRPLAARTRSGGGDAAARAPGSLTAAPRGPGPEARGRGARSVRGDRRRRGRGALGCAEARGAMASWSDRPFQKVVPGVRPAGPAPGFGPRNLLPDFGSVCNASGPRRPGKTRPLSSIGREGEVRNFPCCLSRRLSELGLRVLLIIDG